MPSIDDLLKRLRERADDLSRCHNGCAPERPGVRYPCATEEEVADAEMELGFRLPRLLRAVYLFVGNGGFGPGEGLIGLEGGALSDPELNLVELYDRYDDNQELLDFYEFEFGPLAREEAERRGPKMLSLCNHGCGIWSHVDCSQRSAPVLSYEPGHGWRWDRPSLAEWFEEWLEEPPRRRTNFWFLT